MKNINNKIILIFAAALAVGLFFSVRPGVTFAATCDANGNYTGTSANCTVPLSRGARCSQVCALQKELKDLGYYTSTVNGGNPDGEYGPDTATAVTKFQTANSMSPADGIARADLLSPLGITFSSAPGGQSTDCADTGLSGQNCCNNYPTDPICTTFKAGGTTPPAGGSSAPPPTSGSPCGDPGLTSVNGICVPVSKFDPGSIAGTSTLVGLVLLVLKYLLILSGLIATVALVVGGFWYITAAGNEEQAEKGQKALVNAVIGMVIIIMAYAIVNILSSTLTTTDITKTI